MREEKQTQNLRSFSNAITKTLAKRMPTNSSLIHLEDVIYVLVEAINRGDIYTKLNQDRELLYKGKGWPNEHLKHLLNSGWIKEGIGPIVYKDNRISWYRWDYEMKSIIKDLIYRNKTIRNISEIESTAHTLKSRVEIKSAQDKAINSVITQNLVLLSGGPGTGKTTTIIKMLAKCISINPNARISLAAPTGKASRRIEGALFKYMENNDYEHKESLDNINCQTLHRLLEAQETKFGRNKNRLLELDVLVIDEMSMVDIYLMKGLLDALPQKCQLILVGDPYQLPSIGCGAIWKEIQSDQIIKEFKVAAVNLNKVYRNRGAIASLAEVLRNNELSSFWKEIQKLPEQSNVCISFHNKRLIPEFLIQKVTTYQQSLKSLASLISKELYNMSKQRSPSNERSESYLLDQLSSILDEFVVLCPRRLGPWGVRELNKAILGRCLERGVMHWPEGTPVICGENQPELGLSNGDVGLIVGSDSSKSLLFVVDIGQKGKSHNIIHPARLRKVDPAFALTIHKSQGSEAKEVVLLWPDDWQSSIHSITNNKNTNYEKSLIYTGITRARESLTLVLDQKNS
ncbi:MULTISPECIES: exodeoxyribonuclease V subunit alpha [Prochlorococcus]|uniref:exodeoxyribonuclease V subunit alpha n=1 Tax=Prochlorococcus TaxID=1218 RepID=UPI00053395EB|nr:MULTISPECIES: exodeoxyribonuclease V subunit alpha [Prochlorococcus]KGG12264.1 Exodeoxyribonuclease V alpha chain [Prochlorococcus sp. MIT 0601]